MRGTFWAFLVSEFVVGLTGILMIVASVIWKNERRNPTPEAIPRSLLLEHFPLDAVVANGVLVLITFLTIIPALILPTSRGWLKIHSYLLIVCAAFTLVLGLNEWLQTLRTRAGLLGVWDKQTLQTRSMLQTRFSCCGYLNSTTPKYTLDGICRNDLIAATKPGCVTGFSEYSESWLNLVFTAAFGVVGIDFIAIMCAAMVIKVRGEMLRYRRIDEKRGVGAI